MRLALMSFAHLHAEGYANQLRTLPGIELIGFADDDDARGRHFADRFQLRRFDSYQALLAERPDGVVICSENARHRELTEMAAQAGAHVLCEKPLATTPEDARQMVAACARAGVQLMTAFPMRFSAPVIEIKKLVESGGLGTIYGASTTNQGQLPRLHSAYPRDWFTDPQLAGGGAATDHTVHVADLLRWFLGCEVVEVFAELSNAFYNHEPLQVETAGLIMLTFENGTFATIDCSWSRPPIYPTWGGLTMELIGERGLATVDAFKQVMTVYAQDAARPAYAFWGSDANRGMIAEFAAAIRENRAPAVTGTDGLRAVEIVEAVYRSARERQPVAVAH